MKKTFLKEPFTFLRSGFGKGALILAFFGFFVVAYAVTFPPDPQVPSGLVHTVVGLTAAQGNGTDPSSYYGADTMCAAEFSGASLCDQKDIIHTLTTGYPSPFSTASGSFWINAGVSSGPNTIANDCEGWQTAGNGDVFGVVYNDDIGQFQIQDCRSNLSYACCR